MMAFLRCTASLAMVSEVFRASASRQLRAGVYASAAGAPDLYEGEEDLRKKLLSCENYDTKDSCEEGKRAVRCEWLGLYKCQERSTPAGPKTLSDAECNTMAGNMEECRAGVGCLFDTITGGCHATPSVCSQITCGEERQPPQPLQCFPPFKKVKPEGSCCFICAHQD
eukprot:TRINITY_DN6528_c0_g1_i1.p1 TRINITY_DN6528_c0_g1~~TRINITY_DN6528_c0_g1_i1.p1  ORF type:complete len:168 (-),score=22.67 TRINITY_DN6528_c0_g1_i1:141-644(-)